MAFFLKPGDKLTLLGVLQHNSISTTARKKEEFESNTELIKVSQVYEEQKVQFNIEVVAHPSAKAVALKSAKDLNATWVILDRKMKKDKRFFLERLSCGISRMKRDGRILLLREPEAVNANRIPFKEQCAGVVSYGVMMPGSSSEEDLFSIVISPMGHSSTSPAVVNHQLITQQSSSTQLTEVFGNSAACTTCNNRRPNVRWRKSFSYAELEAATDRFSFTNDMSEAGTRTTFRGQLENKLNIVIKKIRAEEETTFKSLMDRFSTVRHNNLVMLLGCCTEGRQRLIVCEYACNGSLHEYLSKKISSPLMWAKRIKIAVGVARGLNHLHQNNIYLNTITHRKILLSHDFEPMIGDIGMGRTLSDQTSAKSRMILIKTDVHSFGIILLELILSGQMTEQKAQISSAITLLRQRRYLELTDSRILGSFDISQFFQVAQLARKCISKNPEKRLAMDEVVSTLETISKLEDKDEDFPSPKRILQPARHTQQVEAESFFKRTLSSTSSTSGTEKSSGSPLLSGRRSFQLVRRWRSTREAKLYYGEMLG